MIFLAIKLLVGVYILLINVKMPTIVGILTFMSWINFVLSCVEHENSFITLGLMTDHPCLKTDVSDDGVVCITCNSAQHFKIFLFGNMRKDLNGTYKKAIVPICKNRILDFWDCFEKEKSVLTKPFSCPNVYSCNLLPIHPLVHEIWAASRQNLSTGFPTK